MYLILYKLLLFLNLYLNIKAPPPKSHIIYNKTNKPKGIS